MGIKQSKETPSVNLNVRSHECSPSVDLTNATGSGSSSNDIGGTSESESLNIFKYQVFLSFRGPDVRKGFIDHLCSRLKAEGVTVFLDNHDMKYGEEIMPMLYQAIEESQLYVVTFSPKYGNSKWCLKELVKIMACKNDMRGHTVIPVFYNVEPRDVRHADAFMDPKILSQADIGTVLSYKTALGVIGNFKGFSLEEVNGYEGKLVDNVVQEVINIVCPRNLFVKGNIIGRDSIVQDISTWLQNGSEKVEVGMIYGAGGMGKSTISLIVFNKNLYHFTGACFVEHYQREASENKGLKSILEQIISDVSKKPPTRIANVPSGLKQLKEVLGRTKTLLILDDVEDLKELESMFKSPGFFYSGSKIIITTRNQDIGKVCRPVKEFCIEKLSDIQSEKLFYLNAFESAQPPQEYITLSKKFIKYCDGLPLALCTLASSLYDEPTGFWEYTLEKLATGPDDTVQSILRISYDSIKDKVIKDLFLDIAHYFVGMKVDEAFSMLDGLTPYLNVLFPKLVARCLVTVDASGKLMVHQLIQEMAKEVVRQEAHYEPGNCSRLLKCEESLEVIQEEKGTEKVRCMRVDSSDGCLALYNLNKPSSLEISTDGFKKMANLKYLQLNNVQLTGGYSNMPTKIKCLQWDNCQLKSIPADFKLAELVALYMRNSSLVCLWRSTPDIMVLKGLKVINLSCSFYLMAIPDLSGCPALERIVLNSCFYLSVIHESITQLTKLTYLDVNYCKKLGRIPCSTSINLAAYCCDGLVEIGDNIRFELRRDMYCGCAEYIGYSKLESLNDSPYMKQAWFPKVAYQSGIFSAFLNGDYIGKWFTTIEEGLKLTYTVPFLPARRIRAFNIGCIYDHNSILEDAQVEVQVQNKSSIRKWTFIPICYPDMTFKNHTWLTHWPITQHRELNAGDTLKVTFQNSFMNKSRSDTQIKCGIEVLYADEYEEEKTDHVPFRYLHRASIGVSKAEIKKWYDTIFHHSDLSKHEIETETGVYHFWSSCIYQNRDRGWGVGETARMHYSSKNGYRFF